jgi:hypothetical protein
MNYAELDDAIASYMHRSDLGGVIPTFIQLGEARINRDLRVPEMQQEATLNTTNGVATLPDRYLGMRDISYNPGSTGSIALTSVGRHGIARVRGRNGKPIVYSVLGNEVEIRPADDTVDFTLQYWRGLAPLTFNGVYTNPVSERYPYLYLYSALLEAAIYTQDPELAQGYNARYQLDLERTNLEASENRFGESPTMTVA